MSLARALGVREPETSEGALNPLLLYRNLSERSPMPLIAVEGSTHLVRYVNPAFCRLALTTEEDLLGKPFLLSVPESRENGCLAMLDRVYHTGRADHLPDQKHRHKSTETSYWSYEAWAIVDAEEHPAGVMIQVTDTTQQMLTNQHLRLFSETLLCSGLQQHALTQAAEMGRQRLQRSMRETDHRAKNNLQIIVALLDMQITENTAGISVEVLLQLRLHIQTVASFHDLLNHFSKDSPQESALSVSAILHQLLPMWQKMIKNGEFRWSAAEIVLPIKQGMSLALLINELLTNAVKHGGQQIELRLERHETDVTLTISDNGEGFPAEFDPRTSAHFGLEFVESIARMELRGTVTYANNPDAGACVTIAFPLIPSASRILAPAPISTVFEPSLLHATMHAFTALANTMPDHAILLLDEWANIVQWSQGAERLFGYPVEEMVGKPLSQLYTLDEVAAGEVTRELQQARDAGRMSEDRWMQRKDGSRFFASSILTTLTDMHVHGFIKILRNTTEHKEALEYQERRHVQIAVLRERDRQAHELHDTLRQGLLETARQLEEAEGMMGADPNANAPGRNHVLHALNLTRRGLTEIRQATLTLQSPLLQNADLAAALRQLVNETNTNSDIRVELRVQGFPCPLPAEVEEGLLRVGQESLINTLQHAGATYVRIHLAFRPTEIELQIEDNGQGFDLSALPKSRLLGLRGMEQRIDRIHGAFSVSSRRGWGTTIKVVFPLR